MTGESDSRNLKLTIAYDGTAYHGWQVQPQRPTVQGIMTRAMEQILQHPVTLHGASRTDAGVHARGQVAHLHTANPLRLEKMRVGFNALLPHDIRVQSIEEVPPDFHARFDARRKRYCYRIQSGYVHDPFEWRWSWHVPQPVDAEAMQEAATHLVGRHDFSSFERRSSPERSSVRTIFRVEVSRREHIIEVTVEGDGFLYNMVRAIAGTLVEIGVGKQAALWMKEVREARSRCHAGPTAPPQGLFLCWVQY